MGEGVRIFSVTVCTYSGLMRIIRKAFGGVLRYSSIAFLIEICHFNLKNVLSGLWHELSFAIRDSPVWALSQENVLLDMCSQQRRISLPFLLVWLESLLTA